MATQVQLRRGTATENNSFTGAQGELSYDTTNKRVRVHDGATAGGFELKTENSSGDTLFADNEKAIFGAGSDLQIYHDGLNSYIKDAGTGNLYIQGSNLTLEAADGTNYIAADDGAALYIYHPDATNQVKLATSSTGVDITGTLTSDGLTVNGSEGDISFGTGSNITIDTGANGANPRLYFDQDNLTGGLYFIEADRGNQAMEFATSSTNRMGIASNGDISFYEDTGTTPKFFWDASAEGLSIRTTSNPNSSPLYIRCATDDNIRIQQETHASIQAVNDAANAFTELKLDGSSLLLNTQSSGNVGIGTSSPSSLLTIHGSQPIITLSDPDTGSTSTISGNSGHLILSADSGSDASNNTIDFQIDNSQKMRIDSSGNLLVGTTDANPGNNSGGSDVGSVLDSNGKVLATANNAEVMVLNRQSIDGTIAEFRKDGAPVGSIGTINGDAYIVTNNTGLRFYDAGNSVFPINANGASRDNAIDIGFSSVRFDDIYATNGTIQTSDRNEKQDIAELSDAEQRVAVAAKGLLRKFRWRDSVEAKGDDARTHFGIIAQDLQAAFAAEGLDAGDYAMFISSTWTDEETGEERTRMGVRYSELLAFIIAAI